MLPFEDKVLSIHNYDCHNSILLLTEAGIYVRGTNKYGQLGVLGEYINEFTKIPFDFGNIVYVTNSFCATIVVSTTGIYGFGCYFRFEDSIKPEGDDFRCLPTKLKIKNNIRYLYASDESFVLGFEEDNKIVYYYMHNDSGIMTLQHDENHPHYITPSKIEI